MKKRYKIALAIPILCAALYLQTLKELLYLRAPLPPLFAENTTPIPQEIQDLWTTPLTYLGMGSQCLVLSTPHIPFVIKICKATRYQSLQIEEMWPFSCFVSPKPKKQHHLEKDLSHYRWAYTEKKQDTQMVFTHLYNTPSHSLPPITFIDPLGIPHHLPCDSLLFYVQRKGIPLKEYLLPLLEKKNKTALYAFIDRLLLLIWNNQIQPRRIKDINLQKNIGVYEGEPFWLDPGRMEETPLPTTPLIPLLKEFFTPLSPTLATYCTQKILDYSQDFSR